MTSSPVQALIVDDDKTMQRLLADALTQWGFWVTVERDGEWALRSFEQKDFAVVLLDLLLPGINGYEAARQIKALPQGHRVPVVMISGVYKGEILQQEALDKHRAFALLEKPLNLHLLKETLQRALGDGFPSERGGVSPQSDAMDGDDLADERARTEVTLVERVTDLEAAALAQRGDLAQTPFPELLSELHTARAEGALLLRRGKVKKIVYFRKGIPISIKSNLLSECLGRVMVRERMISEAECAESLRRMGPSKRQQGTTLVEMGCISPHNLSYALNLQLRKKLLEVFAWEQGEFQLNPHGALPTETVELGMSPGEIIHEGIREGYDAARLKKVLSPLAGHYVHRARNPLFALRDMGLSEEELTLLEAADGTQTMQTLRSQGTLPTLDADRLLYALLTAGVVEARKVARVGPGTFEAARALVEEIPGSELLDLDPPPLSQEISGSELVPLDVAAVPVDTAGVELLPEISYVHTHVRDGDRKQREKLLGKLAELSKRDYFAVLGVPLNAPVAVIERAHHSLSRDWHPDKHAASGSGEVRILAEKISALITRAYQTLVSREGRAEYLHTLRGEDTHREMGEDLSRMMSAELHFRKGEEALREGLFGKAHEALAEAVRLAPEEGEFRAYLGWALFKEALNTNSAKVALAELETAVGLNPTRDTAYLFMGHIYKAQNRLDLAEAQFEKALQCNPESNDALEELAVLTWANKLTRPRP